MKLSKKRALLNSVLSLMLCISMLLGTTFAWFTDSVTSENNIIKSGRLDAEMYWKNPGEAEWKDASTGAIFNYEYWEPGYVEAKCLKLVNAGDLAFQYRLFVVPNNDMAAGLKLAEVLDVYVSDTEISARADISGMTRLGTLAELLVNPNGVQSGVLLPEATKSAAEVDVPTAAHSVGAATVCIALKMQESAGNEYQNQNFGDGFKVQLLASQYTYENDSFGADYDVNAEWPEGGYTGGIPSLPGISAASGTKDVPVDDKGEVTAETTVTTNDADVKATLPAGVKMADGVTSASFTKTPKTDSDSNITAGAGEQMTALDVHVGGVAADNTTPIIVDLGQVLPVGMNMGNIALYHVENGVTNKMTQGNTLDELTDHNQFYYDPATGFVTVAMATFSEVTIVAEEPKWEGKFDDSWYDADAKKLSIANADQLAAFGAIVGGMNGQTQDSFAGKTVKLIADINLGDKESENNPDLIFYPIGYYNSDGTYERTNKAITSGFKNFEGTFDGNGHTIANFYQNTWEMKGDNNYYDATLQYYRDGMGLFGKVYGGTVKNLTVRNFSSDGEYTTTGTIAAYADGATFENIAIFDCNPRVYNIGNGGIVGCAGWYAKEANLKTTFKNITVDNSNKISALWGSYDVACGGLVGQYYPTSGQTSAGTPKNGGIHMENCHVAAQMDVYNDVCANYQYYAYRYAGILIGSVRENETIDGHSYPKMGGITAEGCTVHFGDWNDYYYCELVANSLASYTHDHQMSRLEQVQAVDGTTVTHLDGTTETITGTRNFVVVKAKGDDGKWIHGDGEQYATCYHFVNGKVWNHEEAGEETVDGKTVLKEDKQLVYREFNNLVTGYGWGVTSKGVGDMAGVTILDRQEGSSVVKFEGVAADKYTTGTTVTIGELFQKKGDATVDILSANVQVAVSPVGGDSTAGGTYTANTADWTQGTLTFSGTGAATITITDYYFCKPTSINVTVNAADKFEKKFTKDFLYRVGNKNTVSLSNLFGAKAGASISDVSVAVDNVAGNASGAYTATDAWENGTIQFAGTGVVNVTITAAGAKPVELKLEVVDAYNRTTASFSGNSVLLNDVSTSSTLSTSGVVYGNGFTVNMENAPISEKNGAVFHLYDGAVLKNLGIVGKEFTTVAMNVNDTNYGVSAVRAWGTVTIENCYISGCRSAVSVTGTELTIKDSVIANGVYANVDFRSGTLNLHNITTVNEPHTVNGTTVVGLGIVGNMTASAGRKLNITGSLTQYNWVSKDDCSNIKASGIDGIFNSVFTKDTYAELRYTYGGTTYVNTGILSLCSDFGSGALTGAPSDYGGKDVTGTIGGVTADGYVWAPAQRGTLSADDMKYHNAVYSWTESDQGTSYIAPAFAFANSGLEQENGVVQIEYESGSSYELPAATLKALLSATKYGEALPYKISMNGTDYTNKSIVFDAEVSQTYTITYTVTDNLVYNKEGTLTSETYEVAKDLKVFATVVDKGADAPTFTFYYGTNGSASAGTPHTVQPTNSYTSTIKQVGETYYIMPNVSATTANAIGSQAVNGETVYYPIVDGINVRSGNTADYDFTRYYPVFKAVKISDNGTEYTYSGTKEMPATVSWASATIDTGNGASSLNDGFGLYNNQYLCKIQKKAGDAEAGGTSVVKYSYTALDGNTYHYYVGYRFYDEDEGGLCFTPDILITLADGTQKRIDEVRFDDRILAWDFFTGDYVQQDISLLVYHGDDLYDIANMEFSDGTQLKIVGEHGVFDYDQNCFVYITPENVKDYVGHRFVKQNLDGGYDLVTLTNGFASKEYTGSYSLSSAGTSNAFASGMLTVAPPDDFYNWIEMDGKLKYDAEQFAKDVETYGLYTYEDFKDYVTYEQFVAWNGAYLKIPVEKGYFTFEYILELIELYKGWMPQN